MNGIVPTADKYVGYEGLAIKIARFFNTGVAPVTPAETLKTFVLMQAAEESKSQNGAVVKITKLWEPSAR